MLTKEAALLPGCFIPLRANGLPHMLKTTSVPSVAAEVKQLESSLATGLMALAKMRDKLVASNAVTLVPSPQTAQKV